MQKLTLLDMARHGPHCTHDVFDELCFFVRLHATEEDDSVPLPTRASVFCY